MSEEKKEGQATASAPEIPAKTKKLFTRDSAPRSIPISVHLPKIFPDYEPWVFPMRMKLSEDAESQRQDYFSWSLAKQSEKGHNQALNEVCDLLTALPTGFGDLVKIEGQKPGTTFRNYIEGTTDAAQRHMLDLIVGGAATLYWNSVMPREFLEKVQDRV